MRILAIETSCDETAAAIIEGRGDFSNAELSVLGHGLHSQIEAHREYGGVYPTVAKREHTTNFVPVMLYAIQQAGMFTDATQPLSPEQVFTMQQILSREPELFAQLSGAVTTFAPPGIDAIAVTTGPGLEPALWVGINGARALANLWNVPVIPVNHMEGHIFSALMNEGGEQVPVSAFEFPVLALLVSGGHTELVYMRNWLEYDVLGSTKDDAVGEAFDKAARLLGLPYPGGPEISKLAQHARDRGLSAPFSLPRPMTNTDTYDFSYSGLKTALRYKLDGYDSLAEDERAAIAREFEDAALSPLIEKTRRAIAAHGPATVIGAGGVIANSRLRSMLESLIAETPGTSLRLSPTHLATDNAAMIGIAAYFRALAGGYRAADSLAAASNARLSDIAV